MLSEKRLSMIHVLKNISTDLDWLCGVNAQLKTDEDIEKIISFIDKKYKGIKYHNDKENWDNELEMAKGEILTQAILIRYGKD